MMTLRFKQTYKFLIVLLIILESCIVPFSPPEVSLDEQYLVVDGFFNVGGSDTSRIELRRTQNVNQTDQPVIETGASVKVEGETGTSYDFVETVRGMYVLPPDAVNMGDKYRIRIQTGNGQEYVSDFVTVSVTPAID